MLASAFLREVAGRFKPFHLEPNSDGWYYINAANEVCGPFDTSAECYKAIGKRDIGRYKPLESFPRSNRRRRTD